MQKRVFLGSLMILIISCLLCADYWLATYVGTKALYALPTALVLLVLVLAGFWELAKLAKAAGVNLLPVSGMFACVAVATFPYWRQFILSRLGLVMLSQPFPVLIAVVVMIVFAEQIARRRTDGAFASVAGTIAAVCYLGVCGALIFLIRRQGLDLLILFLIAVKCADIGAYFVGSAIGKHKLIPWLSPGKSWEGLAGGLLTSVIATNLVAYLLLERVGLVDWRIAVFAAAVGLTGQFADLCESLLKRAAKLKDSGNAVPEFGGVLDIIDSPLLAAPVALVVHALLGPFV